MKLKKLLILVLMSIMATSAIFAQDTTIKTYNIGDDGPGGGIIFYHSEEGFDVYEPDGSVKKCHYLEVSKFDLGKLSWCSQETGKDCCRFEVTLQDIGTGKINTFRIINSTHPDGPLTKENCAAYACYSYSTATTKAGEWFLPSPDELYQLYENLGKRVMLSSSYWSSRQHSSNYARAWIRDFSKGASSYHYTKNNTHPVRAVRAF